MRRRPRERLHRSFAGWLTVSRVLQAIQRACAEPESSAQFRQRAANTSS